MPIVSPPAPRRPARGRAHHATEPAGDDRGAATRQQLADLLGPLEQPMRVRPARIAVADHGDERRPLHGGWIGHAGCPPRGNDASVSYRAGPAPRWLRMRCRSPTASVPSGAAADAASIQPRRSTDPRRARASVTCGRYGSVWASPGRRGGRSRGPRAPRRDRPRRTTPPARCPAARRRRAGRWHGPSAHAARPPARPAPRSDADASGSTEPRKASVRWRASGSTQRNPSVRGSCAPFSHRRARADRAGRRRAATATKQRQRSRHRPSSRASTIGRSSSRAVMTGTSSGTSAVSWRPNRSISTPSIPTPRAPSISATR